MLDFISKTLVGPKENNEDYFYYANYTNYSIACIADGVGGNNCGEIASKLAVEYFLKEFESKDDINKGFTKIIQNIDSRLKDYGVENNSCIGMATTLSACLIYNNRLKGVHIGDTRITILRGNGIKQLTEEHTESARLLNEGLISKNAFTKHPQRNILLSALGSKRNTLIQEFDFELLTGDRIVLSTDGFHEIIGKLTLRNMSLDSVTILELSKKIDAELEQVPLKDNTTYILCEIR